MSEFADHENENHTAESISSKGDLHDHFLPDLLYQMYETKQTGTFVLALGEFRKAIVFIEGEIVFATSNLKEDTLGEALVRRSIISLTDYAMAEELMGPNRRFGEALVEMGKIDESELLNVLTYQIQSIIYSLFFWPTGQYRFAKEKLPPQKITELPVSTIDTILRGTVLIRCWSQLRDRLPSLDLKISRAQDYDNRVAELKLTDPEKRILELSNQERIVSEVCVLSPLSEFETCRFLIGCLVIKLLVTA